ncbi:MAG: hypothetical protein GY842_10605 [bacterium]|nr:hypothetical protein [bacterium]
MRLPSLRTFLAVLEPGDWSGYLVGLGGGLLGAGLLEHFCCLFDPMPSTWCPVLGAFLVSVSIGLGVPHRLAAWLAVRVWRRRHRSSSGTTVAMTPLPYAAYQPMGKDEPLQRVLLGGLALVSGVAAIAALGMVRVVAEVYETLLMGFLWGTGSLAVLECTLAFALSVLVLVPVGLSWSCVHHLACPVGGWRVRPLAGVVAGVATATLALACSANRLERTPADLYLLAGSIPFFVLSILAARVTGSPRRAEDETRSRTHLPAPHSRARWPELLQAAVIVTFGAGILSMGVWCRAFGVLVGCNTAGALLTLTIWSLGIAVGVAAGCRRASRRPPSIGELGMACALAGVGNAVATGVIGALGSWAHGLADARGGGWILAVAFLGPAASGIGYALSQGLLAVLARTSHPSRIGSVMLMRCVLMAAGTIAIVLVPLVVAVGTYAALVAASLVLVGVGGSLIVHEPTPLRQTRRLRLGVVFASVALMSLVLPQVGRAWLATRPWERLRLHEHAWLTRSVWAVRGDLRTLPEPAGSMTDSVPDHPIEPPLNPTEIPNWAALPTSARVAVLGTQPHIPMTLGVRRHREDRLFDPSVLTGHAAGRPDRAGMTGIVDEPATRFLRRAPRRYDLMVIEAEGIPLAEWDTSMRTAVIGRVLDRLRVDGAVLMSIQPTSPQAAELIDYVSDAGRSRCHGLVWGWSTHRSRTTLWLAFGRSAQWRTRWLEFLGDLDGDPADLADFVGAAG